MACADNHLSSGLANTVYQTRVDRAERQVIRNAREKAVLDGGAPLWSMVLTVANMLYLAWFFAKLIADAGYGHGWEVQGYDISYVPTVVSAIVGLGVGWLATSSMLKIHDARGLIPKVLAIMLAMAYLTASVGSTGIFNMSLFESADARANVTEDRSAIIAATIRDAEERHSNAKVAHEGAMDNLDRSRRRAALAAEDLRIAEEDYRSWLAKAEAQFGLGSAAYNRRTAKTHPEHAMHLTAIQRAQNAMAITRQDIQDNKDAQDKAMRAQDIALDILIEARKQRKQAPEADSFIRAADTAAAYFGLRSGKELLLIGSLFVALLVSIGPPAQAYVDGADGRRAEKTAEKIRDRARGRTGGRWWQFYRAPPAPERETSAPEVSYSMSADISDIHAAPVAPPPVVQDSEGPDVATLKSRYATICGEATHDATIGRLQTAAVGHLKTKYRTNDDGASAIRHSLVDESLAYWDGNRCKLIGGGA